MPDGEMPADPFRESMPDWSGIAANNHAFFVAHLAAGFTEPQALDLTGRYMNFVISVIYSSQPVRQEPGNPTESG